MTSSSDRSTREDSGFTFEWVPPTTDYAYLIELTAGQGVECTAERKTAGGFTHESGLGSFSMSQSRNFLITGTASRGDDSAHLGPVNTGQVSGPLWADALGAWYRGSSFSWVEDGADRTLVTAAFDMDVDGDNFVRVDCDGEARLRFFLADAIEPILSNTATGGAGFALGTPPVNGLAAVNMMDGYAIDTAGNRAFFYLRDNPLPDPDVGEPQLEGEVTLEWPEGEETIPFELNEWEFFQALRFWTGAGDYRADLERIALNHRSQIGVLLGFELEEEIGTLETDSTGSPPKTVDLCQDRLRLESDGKTLVTPPHELESGRPISC